MLQDLWNWVESFTNLEKTPDQTKRTWRLDRMGQLLALRGNPHRGRLTVHVAGSKGKGSTCAFLASILEEAGYRTGLYASPHISDYRERITQSGVFFPEEHYTQVLTSLRTWWETLPEKSLWTENWGGPPTTFEFLTLAAFEIFRQAGMTAQVIETGLGGRLDATNTVEPDAVVLTLIEKEHTEILGDTLALIAAEKAGIIKGGIPVFTGSQDPEVLKVFRSFCQEKQAPLTLVDEEASIGIRMSPGGTLLTIRYPDRDEQEVQLQVLGYAQGKNAVLAAWTADHLLRNFPLKNRRNLINRGLQKTQLAGRMQVCPGSPVVVVDGAHTPQSVGLLVKTWTELWGTGGSLVFGSFVGKDILGMAQALAGQFARVWITPPGFYRPSEPQVMVGAFQKAGFNPENIVRCPDPKGALEEALKENKPVLVCGSFYLVSEILALLSELHR